MVATEVNGPLFTGKTVDVEAVRSETAKYLHDKLGELDRRVQARQSGSNSHDYSKRAIRTLVDQINGSLRMAYVLGIVTLGDDLYSEVRDILGYVEIDLKL